MTPREKVQYWLTTAENDWQVAKHLFEKGDYSYSLFFCHLTIEKLLKAITVSKFDKTPPLSHRLIFLAEKAEIELTQS